MIGYIAGFFVKGLLPALPPLYWGAGLPLIAWLCRHLPKGIRWHAWGCLCALVWATLYGHWQLMHRLPVDAGRQDWQVTGTVDSLIEGQQSTPVRRFSVLLTSTHPYPLRRIRLSEYQPTYPLATGDQVSMTVRLRPAYGLANPAGFDYEYWLLTEGIDATGYVRAWEAPPTPSGDFSFARLRAWALAGLAAPYRDKPVVAATLAALILGDKSQLSDQHWQWLQRSGTTHLLIVSGLHIGVAVWIGWWLGRGLGALLMIFSCRVRANPLVLPVCCALLLSGTYVVLAGLSLPTQRAWMMAAVMLLGLLWYQPVSIWRRWWLAMAVVLTLQPLSFFTPGFWLSFGAVATLILLLSVRFSGRGLRRFGYAQWGITVALMPLLVVFFQAVSLSAPLVNLIAIPLVSLIVCVCLPMMLLLLLGVNWLTPVLGSMVDALWYGIAFFAHERFYVEWPVEVSVVSGVAALGAVVVLLQPWFVRYRSFGGVLLLPLILGTARPTPVGEYRVWVFDVGQGNAVLIQTRHHWLLYDTGMSYRSGGSAFERAVLPYLRQQGVKRLDKVVISHADNDHAGGVTALAMHMNVDAWESGMPDALPGDVSVCQSQQHWQWDGVDFTYRHPPLRPDAQDNDRSCVLEISNGSCRLLLTGDASQAVEAQMILPSAPVHWLLAGHHGSNGSTSADFLNATKPAEVLISAGFLNRYGHPHPDVLSRVKEHTARIWRTDLQGALRLQASPEQGCQTSAYRRMKKRYWTAG